VSYTFTGLGIIAAIDPGTGKTIWQFDPETWKAGRPTNLGFLHRGLSYWTDGTVERLFAGTHDAYLISVDAKTGKLDTAFGTGGRVDLTERLAFVERIRNYTVTSAPVVVRNVVISRRDSDGPQQKEMVRGDVSGFDARSGKRTVPIGAQPASTGTIPEATPNTRATRTSGR
jgi:quinoprotein glucose dehydrogenase